MPDHTTIVDEFGNVSRCPIEDVQEPTSRVELPPQLVEFVMRFQTECLAECCGLAAFQFPRPEAHNPQWQVDDTVLTALRQKREEVALLPTRLVGNSQINQHLYKEELVALLLYLEKGIETVREQEQSEGTS